MEGMTKADMKMLMKIMQKSMKESPKVKAEKKKKKKKQKADTCTDLVIKKPTTTKTMCAQKVFDSSLNCNRGCKYPAQPNERFCKRHLCKTETQRQTKVHEIKPSKSQKMVPYEGSNALTKKGGKNDNKKKLVQTKTKKIRRDKNGDILYSEEILKETVYIEIIDIL
jgi:hypothetical protein